MPPVTLATGMGRAGDGITEAPWCCQFPFARIVIKEADLIIGEHQRRVAVRRPRPGRVMTPQCRNRAPGDHPIDGRSPH